VSKKVDYVPHSLKEYWMLKESSNFTYGGLGPNVGTEEWKVYSEKTKKMKEFAKYV
jgi:hypothetical protein